MPCLPGYRYCGPRCSGPGPPTNQLDAFCRQHDACYRKYGPSRHCDDIFLRQLEPYINQRSKLGKDAALMHRAIRLKHR
ncbi:Parvovirus coat protein VP1-like protein [Aquibacillus koreensis]|uniref:Parvovirus coat protein VP1-like protein n=1 Tax=Aquibacillus koreensis TaxID=279446 RepID=A0A9X3WPA7_9BACI|nr:Parvovirus coat protein VP1-like protein [Aquibacillus koreensis]MCT2535418.1 Parvovirus coat protein VP1-like protein [Aquibacillus koreensis]MDC3422253.1 Parvovirus coat protein VP1-like protein [Aquibacillus koreensis]